MIFRCPWSAKSSCGCVQSSLPALRPAALEVGEVIRKNTASVMNLIMVPKWPYTWMCSGRTPLSSTIKEDRKLEAFGLSSVSAISNNITLCVTIASNAVFCSSCYSVHLMCVPDLHQLEHSRDNMADRSVHSLLGYGEVRGMYIRQDQQ